MKILKNYIYNVLYQIVVIGLPLITTPYISRVLQVDGIGRYSVSVAISNYFILIGMLGISVYGNREIAYVRDDKKVLNRVFWEINYLKFITMGISLIAYIIYIINFVSKSNILLYITQVFVLLASIFDISWYFMGLEEFKKTATRNLIFKLVSVLLVFLIVRTNSDLWKYSLIISFSTFIGQIVMWKDVINILKPCSFNKNNIIKHFKKTLKLWIPLVAITMYVSLDKVMLGFLTNDTEVGLYENSQKLVKMVTSITTTLSMVIVPHTSNLFKKNNIVAIKEIVKKSLSLISFIAFPMTFGILAIRNTLIPWFFGSGYERITGLLIISSWLVITLSWSSIFGNQILVAANEEGKFIISVVIAAIVNIILNLFLIDRYKAAGVLFSSVMAEYLGMFIMMYFVRKYICFRSIIKDSFKYFNCSLIMYIFIYYIGSFLEPVFFTTLIQILLGILFYIIIMIVINDKNIKYIIYQTKKIILKK